MQNNGVLAIVLPKETVSALIQEVQNSESKNVTVDLEAQNRDDSLGRILHFETSRLEKKKLLQGLDPVALTLKSEEKNQKTLKKTTSRSFPGWHNQTKIT